MQRYFVGAHLKGLRSHSSSMEEMQRGCGTTVFTRQQGLRLSLPTALPFSITVTLDVRGQGRPARPGPARHPLDLDDVARPGRPLWERAFWIGAVGGLVAGDASSSTPSGPTAVPFCLMWSSPNAVLDTVNIQHIQLPSFGARDYGKTQQRHDGVPCGCIRVLPAQSRQRTGSLSTSSAISFTRGAGGCSTCHFRFWQGPSFR